MRVRLIAAERRTRGPDPGHARPSTNAALSYPVNVLVSEDELALRIGRIARAHVRVDMYLRNVYRVLASPGFGVFLANSITSTNELAENCRVMLAKTGLEERFLAAAEKTLKAAKDACRARNSAVHDMWMSDLDDEDPAATPKFRGYKAGRGTLGHQAEGDPVDLQHLDQVLDSIERASIRVHVLGWGLQKALPLFEAEGFDEDGDLEMIIATLEDRFTKTGSGSWQVP